MYEVQVKWMDLNYEEPTWEPFSYMQDDLPNRMEIFFSKLPNQDMAQQALAAM